MPSQYLKRIRMELDFRRTKVERARLPGGFRWRAWDVKLLPAHAAAKFASFRREMDSHMFPSLGIYSGCEDLMRGISCHTGFLPLATWLIETDGDESTSPVPCGTIQGLQHSTTHGSIQNVGVIPEFRGLGLGRALLLKALAGFRSHGLLRVTLDVTEINTPALRLYEAVGFKAVSTSYREVATPLGSP